MCGVNGIFYFTAKKIDPQKLWRMNKLMKHRGPDDEGVFIEESLGLGHCRLKIIDLSSNAKQPMEDRHKRFIMTYNGECYNYKELREELKKEGIVFRGESDTEVVLESFAYWGVKAFSKFNGMFALAIWDKKKKELTLARDRFGIKPLYFNHNQKRFIFASEIKPLLDIDMDFSLDYKNLYDFFTLRYVPSNETLFKGIRSFRPAHYMVVNKAGIQSKCYWSLEETEKKQKLSPEYLYELLLSSVKYRLNADVSLGSFLSGGIDSASIAELIRNNGTQVNTFTFDVKGKLSEVERAKEIASFTNHRFNLIDGVDIDNLEEIIYFLEEPIGDSILLPTYSLAKGASKQVKVVLSGEGADEVFNGYVHHIILYWLNKFKIFNTTITSIGKIIPINLLNKIHPYPQNLDQGSINKVLNDIQTFKGDMNDCRNFIRMFSQNELRQYLNPDILKMMSPCTVEDIGTNFLNSLTLLDLHGWNNRYTLHRLDRLTMAHALEARVPFLDHRIVEYVINLRDSDRLGLFCQKKPLRRAMLRGGFVKSLCKRKKQAFHLPFIKQQQSIFQKKAEDVFINGLKIKNSEIWNLKAVSALVKKSNTRTFIEDKKLFCFLTLELWRQIFSSYKKQHQLLK